MKSYEIRLGLVRFFHSMTERKQWNTCSENERLLFLIFRCLHSPGEYNGGTYVNWNLTEVPFFVSLLSLSVAWSSFCSFSLISTKKQFFCLFVRSDHSQLLCPNKRKCCSQAFVSEQLLDLEFSLCTKKYLVSWNTSYTTGYRLIFYFADLIKEKTQ